ncbi:oleate hydratase [Afipia massiliensis]|uniref:Oleate hydratase n=1 Tax=Afipia massiliensis TaxID=211460 RepID=A0A840N3Y8_9BRAD|nr:oleate hydratase [Afipia massiliensis]
MADHRPSTRATAISRSARSAPKAYLVGGGIASLAAAAFLIRDGDIFDHNITIFEEFDSLGGSLDGAGSPDAGYVLRGGRMIECKYLCTYDLFASIPTLDERKTVTQEIFDWNETMKTSSKSRLLRDGQRQTAPEFGLSEKHILTIERLALEPERMLGRSSIADLFDAAFFKTNFWFMWCTTFAFQPWHSAVEFKRYLVRFAHMVGGFNRLHADGLQSVRFDGAAPAQVARSAWRDVRTEYAGHRLDCREADGTKIVMRIILDRAGHADEITVDSGDFVLVTLGSMTEASSLGTMDTAPTLKSKTDGGAWTLWEKIATRRPEFGCPSVFADHIDESKWVSFTLTLRDPTFLRLVGDLTGNVPGEGGLITFPESGWLASIVIPHQPHFIGQPENIGVFWGYGLHVDKLGNFVRKLMSACTGREIMTEVLGICGSRRKRQRFWKRLPASPA